MRDNQNFTHVRGDTTTLRIAVLGVDGDAATLTGATVSAMWRTAAGALALTKTGTVATGGIITIAITAADTAALLGEYDYDVQVTLGSNVLTVTGGTMTVIADVTYG